MVQRIEHKIELLESIFQLKILLQLIQNMEKNLKDEMTFNFVQQKYY